MLHLWSTFAPGVFDRKLIDREGSLLYTLKLNPALAAMLLTSAALIAQTQVMTNFTIQAMLNGGIPLNTIIRAIRTAPKIDLYINKREHDQFIRAGASPAAAAQILQAIHDREYNGAEKWSADPIVGNPVATVASPPANRVDVAAQPAPPPSTPAAVVPAPAPVSYFSSPLPRVVLEDGTPVRLRISRNLSSADASTGETVDFEVLEEIKVGDQVVIPKGSIAWGTVTDAEKKRRMGRAGKLNVNLDAVRLADGEKVALRGVKQMNGGGHVGAVTTGIVLTSLVVWPAAPLFLLMHGKDTTIPKGTEITAYTNGNMTLDSGRF